MDLEVNIDPGRLLDFHDVMLSGAQDDERARKAWEASNSDDARRRQEERREAWLEHHSCMQALYSSLAAEHERKASALLEGA